MDRTSWIAIITCFALLIFYQPILYYFFPEWQPVPATEQPSPRSAPPAPLPASESAPPDVVSAPARPAAESVGKPTDPATASTDPVMSVVGTTLPRPGVEVPEQIKVLSNDVMDVALTNLGAGIKWVALNHHEAEEGHPVTLNEGSPIPVLAIEGWNVGLREFEMTGARDDSVTFRRELEPGLVLERIFTLIGGYQIECLQTLYQEGDQIRVMPPYKLSLGTLSSIYKRDAERRFVGLAWHTPEPGGNYKDRSISVFYPGFMNSLGFGSPATEITSGSGQLIQWAAVKTQFFSLIVNFNDQPGEALRGVLQRLPELKNEETGVIPDGIRGTVDLAGFQVNASFQQKFSIYAGPKEDSRLRKMGTDEDRLMQFGIFGVISRPLLMLMNGINSLVGNYGISIILMTIILRAILWYPQTKANLSMKRMQTVAPLMKELQEKYKEKPEKMNQEMMKLYQDYGVNPFGGCLPMLIQFPIFLGFYYMLLGSIELRHASFLWIQDLSQPDTVHSIDVLSWIPIFEGNINPMPLVMAVTMFISMNVMPQPAGVDNPMIKVMKFMPIMFLVICYNFASALSLYWTMQNLLSIVQMRYNMKKEPPTLEALKQEATERKKARKERMKGFGMSARKRR